MKRQGRWLWVRDVQDNVGPLAPNATDLLSTWRGFQGLTLNLPDMVIWRIHIKISIGFHYSPASFNPATGALCAIYVDDIPQVQLNPIVNQYSQQYLMWDLIMPAESSAASNVTPTAGANSAQLFKEYDIRSKRKLPQPQSTLWFELNNRGNMALDTFTISYSILARVP